MAPKKQDDDQTIVYKPVTDVPLSCTFDLVYEFTHESCREVLYSSRYSLKYLHAYNHSKHTQKKNPQCPSFTFEVFVSHVCQFYCTPARKTAPSISVFFLGTAIMTYQKPHIPNYEWESPALRQPAPQNQNHLISISQHKKEHCFTASDSSSLVHVTGALGGEKKVYFS